MRFKANTVPPIHSRAFDYPTPGVGGRPMVAAAYVPRAGGYGIALHGSTISSRTAARGHSAALVRWVARIRESRGSEHPSISAVYDNTRRNASRASWRCFSS